MDAGKYRKLVLTGEIRGPSWGTPGLERTHVVGLEITYLLMYFWTRRPPRRFRTKRYNVTPLVVLGVSDPTSIPTKEHPQVVSELSIVQQRKKNFKDLVKCGNETQTLSVTDQYLRDAVRPMIWKQNSVTFPNGKKDAL
jgi:hypothetical protein